MKINELLKNFRINKNISIDDISKKTKISTDILKKYESGKLIPTYVDIEKISRFYKVNISEILEFSNNVVITEDIYNIIKDSNILRNQKKSLITIFLLCIGICMLLMSYFIEGSTINEFISGFLIGSSIVVIFTSLLLGLKK